MYCPACGEILETKFSDRCDQDFFYCGKAGVSFPKMVTDMILYSAKGLEEEKTEKRRTSRKGADPWRCPNCNNDLEYGNDKNWECRSCGLCIPLMLQHLMQHRIGHCCDGL